MNTFVSPAKHARPHRFRAGAHIGASERARAGLGLLSQRRLRMLRALAEKSTGAHTAQEACAIAAAVIGGNADFPFILIYLIDNDNRRARLSAIAGLSAENAAIPGLVELEDPANAWWPLRGAIQSGALERVAGLDALLDARTGPQRELVKEAAALPIGKPGQRSVGFLLAGVNSRLRFDDDYRDFVELTAGHIAAAVADARACDDDRSRADALAEIARARSQAADIRRQAQEIFDDANRRKGEFLANMSHEIRSPMTAILGYSDILLLHLQDPDDVECVKTIKDSGNYLLEIIDDILDLSKVEAGRLRVNNEAVALHPLLREVLALMACRAREKGLALTLGCESELPEVITTDRTRLRQILVNLLGNAIKFTEKGSVQLLPRVCGQGALLQIDIVDTGIGIPEELQARLFEVFNQGDSSATRRHGGMGLGLALSKRLVEMLAGAITFKSEPGKGSTFSVVLPLAAPDGTAARDFGRETARVAAPPSSLRGHQVLVADDRAEIRYLLRQFLEDAGADVMTAAGGLAAIDLVQKTASAGENIDLIVMDMSMPGLDGYATTRRLRDGGFKQPVIALTAAATEYERDRCLAAGCDGYLAKPVERHALLDAAARHSGQREAAAGEQQHASRAEKSGRKILLVDDHRTACKSMARLLELSGYVVRTAFNGKAAMAAAQEFAADAIILDIRLPDMTGYQLLKMLREQAGLRSARSIALTGYGDEIRSEDPSVNFDHFVLKPVDIVRLESLLK